MADEQKQGADSGILVTRRKALEGEVRAACQASTVSSLRNSSDWCRETLRLTGVL